MDNIRQSPTGAFAQNMVEVATMGVYEAINLRETLGPLGRIPQVGYPKIQPELPRLCVTLDTDNLAEVQGEDVQARDWLMAIGKGINGRETTPCIDLFVTPARSSQGTKWCTQCDVATYDSERVPSPLKRLHGISLNANWEQMKLPNEPSASMIDVKVHQALGRHLFVTHNQSLLNLALIPRPERNVFVLSPTEAQRYVSLFLKAHGRYHIKTNHIVNRSIYYWQRLWHLVPTFQKAWPYTVYGEENLPGGDHIADHMQSLYARLIGQMQASDRIGWLRYSIPTSDGRDEMLNQLNYFFMLATGVFDSLAWIALHRFGLQVGRLDVTLREERPLGRANLFFALLDAASPPLASFLRGRQQQAKIALFYAPRDTIQHRLVLTGAHFNSGQIISDCNIAYLSRDDALAISAVDQVIPENMPFSEWGLMRFPEDPERVILEPYRFTCTALRFLFPFVNEVLCLLDFSGWMGTRLDIKAAADAAIAAAQSRNGVSFDVPFP
jgi:hypothetical protein